VNVMVPYWALRAVGGSLFLIGFFMFFYNIHRTIRGAAAFQAQAGTKSALDGGKAI
jgi:cytochrome c oxidase cbb3-type subunit 1